MKDGKLKPSTINYLYIYMDHGANVYRVQITYLLPLVSRQTSNVKRRRLLFIRKKKNEEPLTHILCLTLKGQKAEAIRDEG